MDLTPDKYHQALAYLTINSSFLGDLGLFHGRMGIVLFFAHYARVTQNKQYEDFAEILLDEIYEEIHWDLPINLENGLCGIGWGIEYLVQNGFMKGNTDEILADIDRKVLEIDPLRISDLSFRRGLAGIIFYVIARLNANRETCNLPFDQKYLDSLQKALEDKKFTEEDDVPTDLKKELEFVLRRNKTTILLPNNLIQPLHNIKTDCFSNYSLGLENGIAGTLWYMTKISKLFFIQSLIPWSQNCIFLIEEKTKGSYYGVGTYIKQLTKLSNCNKWKFICIKLLSTETNTICIKKVKNILYINIPAFELRGYSENFEKQSIQYYRNIYFVLHTYLNCIKQPIIHLNSMMFDMLAQLIKSYIPQSKLILTVHYTSWGFELLGNKEMLKKALNAPQDLAFQAINKNLEREKKLIQSCDRIIAIAQHSYVDLIEIYNTPKDKLDLISHGIEDLYNPNYVQNKEELRYKYGFSSDDQILIFVGRIDEIKGIEILTKAFIRLMKQFPRLKLLVVGDGNFYKLYTDIAPYWSRIICTNFLNDRKIIYDLYSISDIGIIPSLHEEFGFVALEMMMMKVPIISSNNGGLSELINNGRNGISIPMNTSDMEYNIQNLQEHLEYCLKHLESMKTYAEIARNDFLNKYSLKQFLNKMNSFYQNINNN